MSVPPGESLPDEAGMLRALEVKPPFFQAPENVPQRWHWFKPNRGDIAHAESRGRQVGVSVFDCQRTHPSQAVGVRAELARRVGKAFGDARVYCIAAGAVRTIVRPYNAQVDVVSDPLFDDGGRPLDLPGAEGHSEIVGLFEQDPKRQKGPDYKALLDRLAAAAREVLRVSENTS